MLGIVGKKIGMSRIYDSKGAVIPVTLIQVYECCVSDVNVLEGKDYVFQEGDIALFKFNVSK